MNDLQSNVFNLNTTMAELTNLCEESIVYELEQEMRELNERYRNVAEQITKRRTQLNEMISSWKDFEKGCEQMLSWIDCQTRVVDHNEEAGTPSLASDLAQLKECQVIPVNDTDMQS